MKTRLVLTLALTTMSLCGTSLKAQNLVTLKSGTPIEVQSTQTVYARNVEEGDLIKFRIVNDVKQNGKTVIPSGTIVDGRVAEAKKSTVLGTKGRLSIDFKHIILSDGTQVPLTGNVRVSGKNRTPLAIVVGLFVWPGLLIPGSKAVLTDTHYATATVLTNTEISVQ